MLSMEFRSMIITRGILILEDLFFYPRLKKYYKSHLKDCKVIIDVGANKGQSIEAFRSIWKKVRIYSFEPEPEAGQYLQGKYGRDPEIILRNEGVSSTTGKKHFSVSHLDLTSTFSELNYGSKYLQRKGRLLGYPVSKIIKDRITVSVTSLSDFLETERLGVIDLIKIDTEGHEYDCLKGLFTLHEGQRTFHVRYIQFEYHRDDMYLDLISLHEFDTLLKDNGYVFVFRIRHPFGDYHELIYRHRNEA